MRLRPIGRMALAALLLTPAAAPAQPARQPLASLLPELILRQITLAPPATGLSHAAHFSPLLSGELTNPAVALVQSFNNLMRAQLSTFPLGSSSGGFTYTFDPAIGTFRRASNSFGPAFAERAATIGRRRLSVGVNYQHTRFDTFEGQELDDGAIKFYLPHEDCCRLGDPEGVPPFGFRRLPDGTRRWPPFEGDLIEAALSVRATTDTVAFVGNYGLLDRWDVGVAVPLVRVALDASVRATIRRLVTAGFPVHTFEQGGDVTQQTITRTGRATGLGDIVLRTKYRLLSAAAGALAAGLDIRFPTGDEADLLGTGGAQTKLYIVASRGGDRLAQHVNLGYTFVEGDVGTLGVLAAQDGGLADELNYAAGVELILGPRLTVVGDVLGRTLRGAGRLELATRTFEYFDFSKPGAPVFPPGVLPPSAPPPANATAQFEEFAARAANLNLILGTAGVKFNPAGNLLVSAHVLFPLTEAGLRSRLSTVIGLDYAF